MPTCRGPGRDTPRCDEPATTRGLCYGHYRQTQRHPTHVLTPLHPRRRGKRVTLVVSRTCAALAEADEEGATRALEAWAMKQRP